MGERSIFISHASRDKDYGIVLCNFFRDITGKRVFFSSSDTQGVPVNEDIYETLKKEIQNNSYVVCLLSKHYYDSPACLNEMGAAWVCGNEYALLCLPGYNITSENFRRSAINTSQKVVHFEKAAEMKQLAEAVLRSFNITYEESEIFEKCLNLINEVWKISRNTINSYYRQLWDAEEKIKQNLDVANAYYERANAWIGLHEYEKAIKDYLFTIFLDSKNVDAYENLVQYATISETGYKEQALDVAQEMCRRFPANARSYGCRAFVRFHRGELEKAMEDCDKAIEIKKNRWYYNTRGNCWLNKGEYFKALADFWQAHQLSEDYAPPIKNIKRTVEAVKADVIRQEVQKQQELGNLALAEVYLNCLKLAGVE